LTAIIVAILMTDWTAPMTLENFTTAFNFHDINCVPLLYLLQGREYIRRIRRVLHAWFELWVDLVFCVRQVMVNNLLKKSKKLMLILSGVMQSVMQHRWVETAFKPD
jgi:hypothetical protein